MEPSEITEDEILNSESFRLLNLMIDQAVQGVKRLDAEAKSLGKELSERQGLRALKTTVHEERKRGAVDSPALDTDMLFKHLSEVGREKQSLLDRISYLQKTKLMLLNDYDFTRGDDSFQRAVFNLPPHEDSEE